MENKVLKPKIRFKGFTDTWEQRKLGEIATFKQGIQVDLNKQTTEINENSIRFIRIVDYTQNTDDLRYIDKSLAKEYINKEDVVVVRYGATAGFVGHGISGVLANNMFTINPEKIMTKEYLYTYLKQEKIYKLLNESNGSSAMPALNFTTVKDVNIEYPLPSEQIKISDMFKQIDNLITLHQSKYDKLVNVKKALLEKMFPKDGKNVPEIRFKGFADTWEQRKLGEIANIIMGQSPDGINYTDNPTDNILIQGNADLDNGIVVPRIWTTQITKISKPNDIIFTVRAPVGEVAKNTYTAVIGRGVASISGNDFLYQTLKKMKEFDYWSKLSAGSTFDSINSEQLKNSEINIPLNEEQKQIGNFLEKIDNLITLHQHKLEKLKNMKKSLLNKMFI